MKHKKFIKALVAVIVSASMTSVQALPLPESITTFYSPAGQQRFNESSYKQDYWPLSQYFVTERGLAYCAPASIVMVLNALRIERPMAPEHAPYRLFDQENLFYSDATLKIVTPAKVFHQGVTLHQAGRILRTYNLAVTEVYGNQQDADGFVHDLKAAQAGEGTFLVVNFKRSTMGEEGGGHFSPIGAYDEKNNEVLILDVARYKYPPVWVKADLLLAAMDTVDAVSKRSRGYLIVKKKSTMNNMS